MAASTRFCVTAKAVELIRDMRGVAAKKAALSQQPFRDNVEMTTAFFVFIAAQHIVGAPFVTALDVQHIGLLTAAGNLMRARDAPATEEAKAAIENKLNGHLRNALTLCTNPDLLLKALRGMVASGVLTDARGPELPLPDRLEEPTPGLASQFRAALLSGALDDVTSISYAEGVFQMIKAAFASDEAGNYLCDDDTQKMFLTFAEHFDALVKHINDNAKFADKYADLLQAEGVIDAIRREEARRVALRHAAGAGDASVMTAIINAGYTEHDRAAIHHAAGAGDASVMTAIINAGYTEHTRAPRDGE